MGATTARQSPARSFTITSRGGCAIAPVPICVKWALATPCLAFAQRKPLLLDRADLTVGAVEASAACDQLDNRSGVADT
jgi:hypothetical protein